MNPVLPAALFFLLCLSALWYERSQTCPDAPPGQGKVQEVTQDIALYKTALETLRQHKAALEQELAAAEAAAPPQGRHGRSLKAWASPDEPIPRLSEIPRPPTKEKVMAAINRDNPECVAAVEKGFSRHNFNSQFSQDWFVYMNYLHHLPMGFYVDLGASSYKLNSNTWFFDVCLGWNGICVEADATLAADLRKHRTCTVVHACVAERNRTLALQAAGIQIGRVVPLANKGEKGVVVQCRTLRDILAQHGVSHVDLLNMDIEGSEPAALATLPEDDEVSVDILLIENERGDITRPPCFRTNVLRFPLFNREYALVNLLGDDVWVKLTRPSLWRRELVYPRLNAEREKWMRRRYAANPQYTGPMVEKLLSGPTPAG